MARLFLLPGLGADGRLFAALGPLRLPVVTRRLPVPERNEPMLRYALRVAEEFDLRDTDWIGGSSLGGMVAAEIARHRPLAGLVLIGTALSSRTLATPLPQLARLRRLAPVRLLHPLLATRTALSLVFGTLPGPVMDRLAAMFDSTPTAMLREGMRLASDYVPPTAPLCPVHAIHGERDRLMRPPPVAGCRMVADAGHALALSHPQAVTAFLNDVTGRAA
jgi:pimeloyl-ACP methyl ester carboxylesterase